MVARGKNHKGKTKQVVNVPKVKVKTKKHKKKSLEERENKKKRRVVIATVRRKERVREGRNQIKKPLKMSDYIKSKSKQ